MAEEVTVTEPVITDAEHTAQQPKEPEEKVISKKLFDEKVSELNKKNKALEAQLKEKMTEDERKTAEKDERDAEFQALRDELTALKTESAFTAAGIKPEIAKSLSAAIVSADVSAIVEAIKSAVTEIEKDTTARVKRNMLENGSPNVQVAGGSTEKPDPNLDRVKKIMQKPTVQPLSESKWAK